MTIKIDAQKQFGSQAITLEAGEVCVHYHSIPANDYGVFPYSRTHSSGWTITGIVHEDHYLWVNEFEATHPIYGFVKGDFEVSVEASSQEALNHFLQYHNPHCWDYGDI